MADDTPVALAYLDLLRAKERLAFRDTPDHRAQVAQAVTTLDELLETLPHPSEEDSPSPEQPTLSPEPTQSPDGPGNPCGPGPSVSINTTGQDERVVSLDELMDGDER